jgi:DNA repair protein RecN (Recombination protein N)
LDHVQERLETIKKLKKKYGPTLKQINKYLALLKKDMTSIQTKDSEIQDLQGRIKKSQVQVDKMAQDLSNNRRKAAGSLQKKIMNLLAQLGMKKASFELQLTEKCLDENGKDDVEFYISTNPGEDLKPLRKIASGGEISRITLGLKAILSAADMIPTLVFDEVDTGIGGRTAEAVGSLLAKISSQHQIICITHLPQISVFAENHLLVKKEIKGNETFTRIIKLDEEKRRMEIARMLGGKEITKKTVEHAAEFLRKGQQN